MGPVRTAMQPLQTPPVWGTFLYSNKLSELLKIGYHSIELAVLILMVTVLVKNG